MRDGLGQQGTGRNEQPIIGVVGPKAPFREKSTYRMNFSRSRVITAFFAIKESLVASSLDGHGGCQ